MKKLLVLLLLNSFLIAQSKSSSGFTFLTIGNSGREIALSDLGLVGGNKVYNVIYNPSVLSTLENSQVYFTHNSWITDVSAQTIGANFNLFDLPFAINVNNTSIKDIEIRRSAGDSYSKFDARYFYFSLSSSLKLDSKIFFGVTAKYIYENILSDESSGYAADFGLTYKNILENVDLGLSLRNIGSISKLRTESSDLPIDLRFGGSYKLSIQKIESRLILISGIQKNMNQADTHFHLAFEYNYDDLIFIRSGYLSGFESRAFSFGAGLSWGSAELDYSYVPFNYGLGNSNSITLLYNF